MRSPWATYYINFGDDSPPATGHVRCPTTEELVHVSHTYHYDARTRAAATAAATTAATTASDEAAAGVAAKGDGVAAEASGGAASGHGAMHVISLSLKGPGGEWVDVPNARRAIVVSACLAD